MFNTIEQFIEYTTGRMSSGRFGLSGLRDALEQIDNPHLQLRSVHIAGTNGKGSTTNFLRSVFQTAGYKTGSFTSPHLEVHNDRIRIDDHFISDQDLLRYGNRFYDIIESNRLTMFEIDMLIASAYFADNKVDIALYEVGLGGRLDATNLITPMLSLITNIGMDHMEYLGDTLSAIAGEKAGIIKPGVPLITGETKQECIDVFQEVCQNNRSPMYFTQSAKLILSEPDAVTFTYRGFTIRLKGPALYQIQNASLAIEALLKLRETEEYVITDTDITEGLYKAIWKGRFEVVHRNPTIVLDGAHNEHGVQAILSSIQSLPKPVIAVFTALRDKKAKGMIENLLTVCDKIIVTEFAFYRGAKAEDLASGLPVEIITDPMEALRYGYGLAESGSLLITGSLYFISDVRKTYLPQLLGKE